VRDQPRELPKPARQLLAQPHPGERHQQLDLCPDGAADRRRKRPPQPVAPSSPAWLHPSSLCSPTLDLRLWTLDYERATKKNAPLHI
jgi:hypothetical protein